MNHGAVPPPCVILTRRGSGAEDLLRLLAPHRPSVSLGVNPLLWNGPLGEVSRRFHGGDSDAARHLLAAALAAGPLFLHAMDTESHDFNRFLLPLLTASSARVIRLEREDEAHRLFSRLLADHLGADDPATLATLPDRLRQGEPVALPGPAALQAWVRDEQRYRQIFDTDIAATPLTLLPISHEALFCHGVQTLARADELFAFAGAGSRSARLDDASLLRFAFGCQASVLDLRAAAPALRDAHRHILAALGGLPPIPA